MADVEVLVVVHTAEPIDEELRRIVESQPEDFRRGISLLHVLDGGRARPLNVGLDAARGRYLAFLDDDDLANPDWIETFADAAARSPRAIIRSLTVVHSIPGPPTGEGDAERRAVAAISSLYARPFDLLQHLESNGTPICSFAVPINEVRAAGVRFDESLAVNEDWDFLLRLAFVLPVHDTGRITSVYQQWIGDKDSSRRLPRCTWEEAQRHILAKLDETSIALPRGTASRIVSALRAESATLGLAEASKRLESECAALSAQNDTLRASLDQIRRSLSWRALKPLHAMINVLRRIT